MSESYEYYWKTLDGKHSDGPFDTIRGLKSGIQTSRWGTYWDKKENRWRSYAKDGIIITRVKITRELDTTWQEEWKK